ncbi:MAG TPA: fatty acid desaturase family protein [Paracoccaceae bacterium]|nr:fatty acid desaturase family protein [Paracoccaceae bacterium]
MTAVGGATAGRDYSLSGPENARAVAAGLASAEWYHSDVPRKEMKELMRRSDEAATRDTAIWLGVMAVCAICGIALWGSWLAVPFFLIYGVLYGSACDSRWHECGHGTAFKTGWKNDVVYHIASFMVMRNPVMWKWSHARHHTDTIIVGRDPEIAFMRPTAIARLVLKFFGLPDIFYELRLLARQAGGVISDDEKDYIPEDRWPEVIFWARVHMAIYAATVLVALITWSIIPLLLIGGPRIYGSWHMVMMGLLQHGGLAEDVLDHRLNSRTVYINPVSAFIYWNMQYHVEHHMFPMVPYHALPRLHALIKDDLPPPNRSILEAYGELFYSLRRQRSEPDFAIRKELPPTAASYRADLTDAAMAGE